MPAKCIGATLIVLWFVGFRASEANVTPETQRASELLSELLSSDISDEQWSTAEKQFDALPPRIALPVLFPEIAKGIPFGESYASYNCYDPLHDRKVLGWGEYCIVNWLWCKQTTCPQKRVEVSMVLLELWAHPISYDGQMVLLEGLCGNSAAESRIAALLREATADVRLRTVAAQCLLFQDETKYHSTVVEFAERAPIRFIPPGRMSYPLQIRRILFDELARHRYSGIDPAVVRIGFGLLLEEDEQRQKASASAAKPSYYGEFIYANSLNAYLGTAFVPDRELSMYSLHDSDEKFWNDTVVNALDWWSKNKQKYAEPPIHLRPKSRKGSAELHGPS